jgi:hypothetical protein
MDPVNKPQHYLTGGYEAIAVIEAVVATAPDPVSGGCQWQALKYLWRLWAKGKPLEDAKKARFYLDRLISRLEAQQQKQEAEQ